MNLKTKVLSILALTFLLLGGSGYFFSHYQLIWQQPLQVSFIKPIRVQARETVVQQIIVQPSAKEPQLPLSENEKYLCIKFGSQCKKALEIQRLENGSGQCDRFHVNGNGSVDFGMFQINSIHLKNGYKLADLLDCKRNIDIAYELYSKQGWGIWATNKLIK